MAKSMTEAGTSASAAARAGLGRDPAGRALRARRDRDRDVPQVSVTIFEGAWHIANVYPTPLL
jgi:hypothetical protein